MFDISPTEWMAILLSLKVSVVATLFATPIGIGLAWALARYEFWGKSIIDAAVHLPLVLPPVVTGYLLLLTFGRRGLVGAMACRSPRDRFRISLDRRSACLRRDVVPAAGTADPAVDRSRRPAAGTGREHARGFAPGRSSPP